MIALHAHRSHDRDLEIAGCCTIGQLHRFIATLPVPVDPDPNPGPDDDDDDDGDPDPVDKQEPNAVTLGWGEDGRYRGRIDVDGKLGSLFELMLRAGRRKVYRDRHGSDTVDDADLAAVTGADAMEAAAHAALDALDPSTAKGGSPSSRYQVFVHIDADNPDRARIHLGPLLPRSVRDQILCDAELRAVLWRGGRPVGLGRKHRVADPLLRALIEERDGGCCVPGCERHGYLHIHHLVHWPAGGPTDPHNLVALCTEHHRLVHAGLLQLVGNPETGTFEVLDRHRERWPRHDEFRWF